MSRMGVRPPDAASSTTASTPAHEYSGDVGSLATKSRGRAAGAIELHDTMSLTKLAPAACSIGKATACCAPPRAGSKNAVRSGSVARVEITLCRGVLASADMAAVTATRAQAAETAHQRSPRDGRSEEHKAGLQH